MFPKLRREQSQLAGKANVCRTYPGRAVLPNVDAACCLQQRQRCQRKIGNERPVSTS